MTLIPPSTTPFQSVPVELGDRSYDVLIGPDMLAQAADLISARLGSARCVIVTDENVQPYYFDQLRTALTTNGQFLGGVVLPAGESTKSFANLQRLCDELLGYGLERRDCVVALGGGVIGDLAGFAASIVRRGVPFVQIPTSLLAQVDSSVGGKTGINTSHGKNLLGAFHQPNLVIIDTSVLSTLPARQMRAGYAEVAKYGLLGDAGFFEWLERDWRSVFGNDVSAITRAIETSCRAKAAIVARDETETGERALLNLGHTFGHALEAATGYSDRLLHGEGVAIGMVLAFALSEELGHCAPGTSARVAAHLKEVGLPTRIADIPGTPRPTAAQLAAAMAQDKKVQRGQLTFILARKIGETFISRDVPAGQLAAFLEKQIGR